MGTRTVPQQRSQGQPWKYVGYRAFSDFVASDNDFFLLRRFSQLHARILLSLQDELSELEGQLQSHEASLADQDAPNIHNGTFRQETSRIRLDLIKEIDQKLRSYNKLVLQHSDLRARPRVATRDIDSVSNWFYNNRNAILPDETRYIKSREDLFAIVPKDKTPLRRLLEKSSRFRLSGLWKRSIDTGPADERIHYTSDQRIDLFVAIINAVLGMIMLIAPLWTLAYVGRKEHRLAVITCFLVCFLSLVTFATPARPFESLGATAAYAAVLVVFLQVAP